MGMVHTMFGPSRIDERTSGMEWTESRRHQERIDRQAHRDKMIGPMLADIDLADIHNIAMLLMYHSYNYIDLLTYTCRHDIPLS